MRRLLTLVCVCACAILYLHPQAALPTTNFDEIRRASDDDDDYDEDDDYDDDDEYDEGDIYFGMGMNLPGDQYIKLTLGLCLPLNFPNPVELFRGDAQLSIGGMGTLGYHYLLSSKWIVGFDIGFGFNVSIGSHVFNYVPFVFSVTYQPTVWRLEFPLTLGIGFAWESFSGDNYFPGLVVKPEAGCMFRLTESWSLGLDASYLLMPQFSEWYGSGDENYAGQFFTISLAARYHF